MCAQSRSKLHGFPRTPTGWLLKGWRMHRGWVRMHWHWTVTGRSLYSTALRLDPKSLLCSIGKNMPPWDVVKITLLNIFCVLISDGGNYLNNTIYWPAERKKRSSAEKARLCTSPLWWNKVVRHVPFWTSQMQMRLLAPLHPPDADAMICERITCM